MNYLSEIEIENYMQNKSKYLEKSDVLMFKNVLAASNITLDELDTFKFKSPTLGRILSVILGSSGIDRFYTGNYLLGFLKLFTGGGFGVWWIIDWFLIGKAIKKDNQIKFYNFLTGKETTSPSFNENVEKVKNVLGNEEVRQSIKETSKSVKKFFDTF